MLDERDRKLLALLQQDASVAVGELAERVNLSLSACSRRIQRLEEAGYIARRIVVLDRERMGVPTTVFALIKTAHHSDEWIETFRRAISDIPEIVEAHRLTGNHDYIVKVVLPRVEHYDVVYKQIVRKVGSSTSQPRSRWKSSRAVRRCRSIMRSEADDGCG